MVDTLLKWKKVLAIEHWIIKLTKIDKDQVVYADDVDECDRYFIGIVRDYENCTAEIFYDRTPTEEDMLHELLHLKLPSVEEHDINRLTHLLLI